MRVVRHARRVGIRGSLGMGSIVLLIAGGAWLGVRPLPAQTPAEGQAAGEASAALTDSLFNELAYRFIGPLGNRVISVIGEPGNPNVYYVGAASGGIFKSTDGGHRWEPIFDDQPVSSIGSLALAPSDPNVLWAGTGETFIRANISIGNGVYRSTDAGKTWEHMGLDGTERIGRIRIEATNPEVVYVCALGSIYGPGQERGVYRTTDGGRTWKRILFVDENTGCSDLAMDPNNSRILFAGFWQIHVTTWGRRSGGPGSSLWASRDGGDTWKKLEGHGLPKPPWGKIGLGMTAADSRRVYALIETSSNHDFAPSDPFQGVLWRSDDGGASWSMVNNSNDLTARPLYYTRLLASPADADEVYFMALRHSTSLDGGKTHFRTPEQPGGDHHDMWIDPEEPDRMIVGHDQGISISTNHGKTWYRPQLPVAQVYHANVDDRIPYYVYGNRQDGPSTRGPSNTLTGDEIPIGAWRSVGGCETGFAVPDTVAPDVVWTGCYDGILDRHNLANGYTRNVSVWPVAVESWPARDLKYRWQWTFPIAISPHDHNRVYVGSQYVHMTTDGGQSWKVISPDLTSNDPELERRTGGLTLDDAGPTIAPVVFAIAESALQEGLIWAGTNDGRVQVTRDGGGSWTDVTGNLPGLPPRGTVSNINPSRHAPGTAYLTVDRHQLGDTEPYVYRTTDYGASWQRIDRDIPRSEFSYAHCVREDPAQPGLLYLGTENGIWVSFDDGAHWRSLQSNLPHAPVHWITVQERFGDLVVATYGRGFWILDDLAPLRELARASAVRSSGGRTGRGRKGRRRGKRQGPGVLGLTLPDRPALLAPRAAYRFRTREAPMSQPHDPAAGHNPEYGASLHYFLPNALGEDATLKLAVLDSAGTEVFHFKKDDLSRKAGLHRLYWSLRSDRTRELKLRTKPEENPKVEMPDKGWRPLRDGGRISILEPPGRYTVRLTVGDTTITRPLTVLKDPNSLGSVADIAAQMEVLRDLYGMLNRSAATINEIEWLRRQLQDLAARLEDSDREDAAEITAAGAKVEDGLKQIEGTFFDLRHTGAGQDGLRWKRLLYARIGALARSIGGSDYPPTEQAIEVADMLRHQLEAVEKRFSELKAGPLAEFNAMLRERGVPNVLGGVAGK